MFRNLKSLLTFSVVATVLLSSFAAAAEANDGPRAVVRKLNESRSEVLRYWTSERIRTAKPAKLSVKKGPSGRVQRIAGAHGKPHRAGGHQARLEPHAGSIRTPRQPKPHRGRAYGAWYGLELPWSIYSQGYTSASKAVGRLFFRKPNGLQSYCSASVVATNVILTAAHCVEDGASGADNSTFEFRPGVYGSTTPYGSFVGRAVSVYNGWANKPWNSVAGTGGGGYWPMDYAFITLRPNAAGYNVGQYTGSFGLWPNAPKSSIYLLGYPGEGSWAANVNYPYHCNSPIQRYDTYYENRYDVGLSCYNTGGSSGGPWFMKASDGRSYITSVMSHMGVVHWQSSTCQSNGCPRYGRSFYGPYINNETTALLNIAKMK